MRRKIIFLLVSPVALLWSVVLLAVLSGVFNLDILLANTAEDYRAMVSDMLQEVRESAAAGIVTTATTGTSERAGERSDWNVMSAGGSKSEGGGYAVTGTLTQTAIGQSLSSSYSMHHGFWQTFDTCTAQNPGDANGDGTIAIADIVYILDYICLGGPAPQPLANGDPNGDCVIDSLDALFLADVLTGDSTPVACTCTEPFKGSCETLDICANSYCDSVFLVCPAGDAPFRVYLRDEFDEPISGVTSVYVEFLECNTVDKCPDSNQPFTVIEAATPSDENGMLTFFMKGGGCDDVCQAIVKTTACEIAVVPVKMFDITGDLIVSITQDFNYSECNEYTGEGLINHSDYTIFSQHVGHRCDIDQCNMFGHELVLDPAENYGPNEEITITLNLFNNNHDSCLVNSVGFFANGFGLSGEQFIANIPLDSILAPGQSASVLTSFIIPDTGLGCIVTRFTTDCCSTVVEDQRCLQPIWICAPEELVCYEFSIGLDSIPILDTAWIRFLPPSGWTSWEVDIPEFPLFSPDTIVFSICTPDLVNLGDTASVIFIACLDDDCTDVIEYECRVMITSNTGDANADCDVNIGDAVYLINYIFNGGDPPNPYEAGDVNCDGFVNIGDPVYLVNYIFRAGTPPCLYQP